jgi:hypothetical protein
MSARPTQLLAKVERPERERSTDGAYVSGRDTGFRGYLKQIGLNKNRANECERIAAIPEPKFRAAFGGRPSENCPGSGQFRAYLREIGLTR